jgi:hypothetical protein
MKNSKLLPPVILLSFAFFSWSCNKDDGPADIRDQMLGIYGYSLTYYEEDGTYISGIDESGSCTVKKNTSGNGTIDVVDDGKYLFRANNIDQLSTGLSFEIPAQTFSTPSGPIGVIGYKGVNSGGMLYHGSYQKSSKKLTAYFEATGNGNRIRIKIDAFKK